MLLVSFTCLQIVNILSDKSFLNCIYSYPACTVILSTENMQLSKCLETGAGGIYIMQCPFLYIENTNTH